MANNSSPVVAAANATYTLDMGVFEFYFLLLLFFFFVLSFMAISYAFPMLLTALSEGVLNIFYGLLCAPNNHFGFPPRATGIFGFKLH